MNDWLGESTKFIKLLDGSYKRVFQCVVCLSVSDHVPSRGRAKYCSDKCRKTNNNRKSWAKSAKRKALIIKDVQSYARQIKIDSGCVDCGLKGYHYIFDFDHVFGVKWNNISAIRTMDRMIAEIAKCEVVCSNCHRVRTWDRKHKT